LIYRVVEGAILDAYSQQTPARPKAPAETAYNLSRFFSSGPGAI
jgi:hypothetical protein